MFTGTKALRAAAPFTQGIIARFASNRKEPPGKRRFRAFPGGSALFLAEGQLAFRPLGDPLDVRNVLNDEDGRDEDGHAGAENHGGGVLLVDEHTEHVCKHRHGRRRANGA